MVRLLFQSNAYLSFPLVPAVCDFNCSYSKADFSSWEARNTIAGFHLIWSLSEASLSYCIHQVLWRLVAMDFGINGRCCWGCKSWERSKCKFWDCSDFRQVGHKTSSSPIHINKNMIYIFLNKNSETGYTERRTLGLSHYRCFSRIYVWDRHREASNF